MNYLPKSQFRLAVFLARISLVLILASSAYSIWLFRTWSEALASFEGAVFVSHNLLLGIWLIWTFFFLTNVHARGMLHLKCQPGDYNWFGHLGMKTVISLIMLGLPGLMTYHLYLTASLNNVTRQFYAIHMSSIVTEIAIGIVGSTVLTLEFRKTSAYLDTGVPA